MPLVYFLQSLHVYVHYLFKLELTLQTIITMPKKVQTPLIEKGPQRMVQSGLIAPHQMKYATFFVFALAFLLGLYLSYIGGWPIFLIGIISIACGYLYTAGPYAIAYNGLGDIFALVFFGPVAVAGTVYIQIHALSIDAIIIGIGIGLISTALLAVNNVRDINEDKVANKHTLVVRFGKRFGQLEYSICLLVSFIILFYFTFSTLFSGIILISYSIYLGVIIKKIWTQSGSELNNCLANTGLCLIFYGLIF